MFFLFIHINRLKQLTPNLHKIPLLLYRASATTTQPWVVEIFIFALLCLFKIVDPVGATPTQALQGSFFKFLPSFLKRKCLG